MKFTLPIPPSVNRYWRQGKGRVFVSNEARAYKTEAGWLAKMAGVQCVPAPQRVSVHLRVYRPQQRGDLDNYLKVLLDSLNGIAWDDDSQVFRINATLDDDKDEPRIEVEVKKA